MSGARGAAARTDEAEQADGREEQRGDEELAEHHEDAGPKEADDDRGRHRDAEDLDDVLAADDRVADRVVDLALDLIGCQVLLIEVLLVLLLHLGDAVLHRDPEHDHDRRHADAISSLYH